MKRVIAVYYEYIKTYLKDTKGSRLVFVGDGYGVGHSVASLVKIKSVSTETDPMSRYKGISNGVIYIDHYGPLDLLIYLHVDETIECKVSNPCIVVGYHSQKYGGRNGVFSNVFPILSVRIGTDLVSNESISDVEYIRNSSSIITFKYKTVYFIKERTMIYSMTDMKDLPNVIGLQKGVRHLLYSSVRLAGLNPYRIFNDGSIYLYSVTLRLCEVLEICAPDHMIFLVGNEVNTIKRYGDKYSGCIVDVGNNEVNMADDWVSEGLGYGGPSVVLYNSKQNKLYSYLKNKKENKEITDKSLPVVSKTQGKKKKTRKKNDLNVEFSGLDDVMCEKMESKCVTIDGIEWDLPDISGNLNCLMRRVT